MVNSPKTLTVTYGAFSCTLEGFDESFETIKKVAQYFRGIAAEDPAFGVEQGKLHGDALAQIAPVVTVSVNGETIALTEEDPAGSETPPAEETGAPSTVADAETVAARLERVRAAVSPEGSTAWPHEAELDALGRPVSGTDDTVEASPTNGDPAAPDQAAPDQQLGEEGHAGEPAPAPQPHSDETISRAENIFADPVRPVAASVSEDPERAQASGASAPAQGEPPVRARIVRMRHKKGAGDAVDAPKMPDEGQGALDIAALDGMDELEQFARPLGKSDASEDIDRLLDHTEREISDPEAGRRRASLSHLKAAVVATEAARDLGESDGTSPNASAFRDDLNHVVGTGGESPSEEAQRPLRLTRSQRVGLPDGDAPDARISPRRASEFGNGSVPDTVERDGLPESKSAIQRFGSFNELCDHIGADGLVDRVEAGVTLISKQSGVSVARHKVARMIQDAAPEPPTNEEIFSVLGELVDSRRLVSPVPNRFEPTDDTFRRLEALAY